ncbi:hypothetical protein R3P38DRAFT_2978393 [Favolaschia claudopus]|uniref:Uncharacterized protein n=1 Tax=Favolaschia claudopus TaxID=2862362 RepID=A0AAW0B0M9_9AGAR
MTAAVLFESNSGLTIHNELSAWCKNCKLPNSTNTVRVIGELTVYKDRKQLRADNVFAAPNSHEVYAHILMSIHDTMIYEVGPVREFRFHGQYIEVAR